MIAKIDCLLYVANLYGKMKVLLAATISIQDSTTVHN